MQKTWATTPKLPPRTNNGHLFELLVEDTLSMPKEKEGFPKLTLYMDVTHNISGQINQKWQQQGTQHAKTSIIYAQHSHHPKLLW